MRRSLHTVVILCALAQLALGASSAMGAVLCVARDHSAIELPSDDCCTAHQAGWKDETKLEDGCCYDILLSSTTRCVSEARRARPFSPAFSFALAARVALATTPLEGRLTPSFVRPSPTRLVLRAVILRI